MVALQEIHLMAVISWPQNVPPKYLQDYLASADQYAPQEARYPSADLLLLQRVACTAL